MGLGLLLFYSQQIEGAKITEIVNQKQDVATGYVNE